VRRLLAAGVLMLPAICLAEPAKQAAPATTATPDAPITGPQATTATYGDWVLACQGGAAGERMCEVSQSIQVQGQKAPIAQIGRS
jgi:invasion protein IalB